MVSYRSITDSEETVKGRIKINLLGVFKKAYGSSIIEMEIEKNIQLNEILQKLVDSSTDLKRVLIDPELGTPLPNAVILLNGRDISSLNGLKTSIKDGDEIILIPVIHGG